MANDRLLRSFGKNAARAFNTPEYQQQAEDPFSEHLLLVWNKDIIKGGKAVTYGRKTADQVLTSVDSRNISQTPSAMPYPMHRALRLITIGTRD